MKIGAQLFTVRDFCKTTDGLAETLKRIADIGYTTVQVSGTCEYDPSWLKNELDKNNLECVLTHTAADKLKNDPHKVADDHDIIGCKYIGLGWFGFDGKTVDDFKNEYIQTMREFVQNGKYFMYHNHDMEFRRENGKLILEKMAEVLSPKEMGFTLDTYWVQVGGGDPAQWIEKLSGRVPCIHLKDCAYGRKMAPIGEGNINFDRVFEKAESAGTQFMLVEQDDCYDDDPFDCLARSYKYLHALGFN